MAQVKTYSRTELKELKKIIATAEVDIDGQKVQAPILPARKTGKVTAKTIYVSISPPDKKPDNSVKIINKLIRKESGQAIDDDYSNYSMNFMTPYVSPDAVKMFYEQNPYDYRSIHFKSSAIAGIGCDILPYNVETENIASHPQHKKLSEYINNPVNTIGESFEDVLMGFEIDYCNFGNSYLEIVPDKKKELAELYNLRAYNTRISFDKRYSKFSDGISFLQLVSNTEAKKFKLMNARPKDKSNEILWHKNYNPFNKFYGYPEKYSATANMALSRSADEYNIRAFQNDLMISFAILVEGGELEENGLSQIEEFLSANYKGVANSSKALYLNSSDPEVKITITKVQDSVREASFSNLQDRCRDNVIVSHGVLAALMGIKTPGQLGMSSELDTLFQIFNETLIKPEKRKLQFKLNSMFKSKFGIDEFYLKLKELTFEKFAELIQFARDLTFADVIDPNEARARFDLPPRDEDNENKIDKALGAIRKIKLQLENE